MPSWPTAMLLLSFLLLKQYFGLCLLDSVYFVTSYSSTLKVSKPFPFTQKFVNVQVHVGLKFP